MSLFKVLVKKASTKVKSQYVEIESSTLGEEVFEHIFTKGLEAIVNSRMSGDKVGAVTKLSGKELENAQAAAMKIAQENIDDLKAGKITHTRGKPKSTIPAAVRAEAMRLAKAAIKDWVRANGVALKIKPSHFSEKAYTAKAKEYVESDPAYLEQAYANIEARKTPTTTINLTFADLGPKVVRKAAPKANEIPAGALPKAGVQTVHRPTVN